MISKTDSCHDANFVSVVALHVVIIKTHHATNDDKVVIMITSLHIEFDCSLKSLFVKITQETSKFRITGLLGGESIGDNILRCSFLMVIIYTDLVYVYTNCVLYLDTIFDSPQTIKESHCTNTFAYGQLRLIQIPVTCNCQW